jgi:hypothetical protein
MKTDKAWARRIDGLTAAREWAEIADIPAAHRHVIIRALESDREHSLDALADQERMERDGTRWAEADIEILMDTLEGRVANSWAEEKYHLAMAAERLHRSAAKVKRKAIELGLGQAVDYWLVRENHED